MKLIDLRLVPAACCAWAGAAWSIGAASQHAAVACAVVTVIAGIGAWLFRHRRLYVGGIALCFVALLGAVMSAQVHHSLRMSSTTAKAVESGERKTIDVHGIIRSEPALVASASVFGEKRYRVDVTLGPTPILVIGGAPWQHVEPGQTVAFTAKAQLADPGDDITVIAFATGYPVVIREAGWMSTVTKVRQRATEVMAQLPGDVSALGPALATGDERLITETLDTAMKVSGLTHMTAVSGSHCVIVITFVNWLLAMIRMPRIIRACGVLVALSGFTVLVGSEPSVVRAVAMAALGAIGIVVMRPTLTLATLAVTVLVLCVADPWIARSWGFILSVVATVALVVIAPLLARWLERVVSERTARLVAIPLAAQVCCAPVLAMFSSTVGVYTVPANIIGSVFLAPATVLSLSATLMGSVWFEAGRVIAYLAWTPVQAIAVIATVATSLPGAAVEIEPGPAMSATILMGLIVVGVGAYIGERVVRRARLNPAWPLSRGRMPVAMIALCSVLAVVVAVGLTGLLDRKRGWVRDDWFVIACDVGQGSATLVRSGAHSAVLIDAGPDDSVSRCIADAGITTIDAVFLTHDHADHVGGAQAAGLDAVLAKRSGIAVYSSDHRGSLRPVVDSVLTRHGARRVAVMAGDRGSVGSLAWNVMWPRTTAPPALAAENALNNASVAVELRTDTERVLIAGDLEEEAQSSLVRSGAISGRDGFDVVVVPHHGASSQSSDLVELLAPRVSLISCGANNTYGHPSDEALGLYLRHTRGGAALRTDEDGELAVGRDDATGTWWTASSTTR